MSSALISILVLMFGGYVLIVIDILIVPGAILAIIGTSMIGYGVFMSYDHFGSTGVILSVSGALILLIVSFYLGLKMKIWDKFILKTELKKSEGFTSPDLDLSKFIGREAQAFSFLRPAGIIHIEGQRFNAVSDGTLIEKGKKVKVISIKGKEFIVKEV